MKYIILALALVASTAQADGFYIEGGFAAMEKQSAPYSAEYSFPVLDSSINGIPHYTTETITATNYRHYDINDVRNPYGALSMGYDWRWRIIVIDLQLQHQSSIAAGDHGQNTLRLNVRWYPFH